MMEINQEVLTNASAIFGAIGAIVFGAQKAIKAWSNDRGDIQKIGLETELFNRMSSEIKRLSETNQNQEKEIQELRDKCATISEDFVKFKLEAISKDMALLDMKRQLIECTDKVLSLQQVNIANGAQ